MRIRAIRIAALAAVALLAGCRSVAVESEPGPVYAIEVYNPYSFAMTVSYSDDRGDHELGTVASRARQRFVIAGSTGPLVTIRATSEGGSRTARPKSVTLVAGETIPVTLEGA